MSGVLQTGKVFVVGLPRTGTTALCHALLHKGLKVAHTAYTQHSFALADAIADAPVFSDYVQLDRLFPQSKFVYLNRDLQSWLRSIKSLLQRVYPNLHPATGRYNPIIKRCYHSVFHPLDAKSLGDERHLAHCYREHQRQLVNYFACRPEDFLWLELGAADNDCLLSSFLGLTATPGSWPRLNSQGQIAAWDKIRHPNKVSSNASGPQRRRFFDYI